MKKQKKKKEKEKRDHSERYKTLRREIGEVAMAVKIHVLPSSVH